MKMMKRMMLWIVLAAALACPGWAHAQENMLPDGFTVQPIEAKPAWICIGISALALAGVCVVAFKNARRSHLD
jgi:hypothetical protein